MKTKLAFFYDPCFFAFFFFTTLLFWKICSVSVLVLGYTWRCSGLTPGSLSRNHSWWGSGTPYVINQIQVGSRQGKHPHCAMFSVLGDSLCPSPQGQSLSLINGPCELIFPEIPSPWDSFQHCPFLWPFSSRWMHDQFQLLGIKEKMTFLNLLFLV